MTSRILLCIVPLLLAAVASGDPGELFSGKGRDPASQPDARPVVVGPPPASQPAAKLPTSQPEVLTVETAISRLPVALVFAGGAVTAADQSAVRQLLVGQTIAVTSKAATVTTSGVVYQVAVPVTRDGRRATVRVDITFSLPANMKSRPRVGRSGIASCAGTIHKTVVHGDRGQLVVSISVHAASYRNN